MTQAKLNSEFIATVAGDITVFNYDGETREYLSSSVEYLPVGVGVPANSCTDAPGEPKDGTAICRTEDSTAWEYVADHRGEKVYSTETGDAMLISLPGEYPEGTTRLAPATPYDVWNGSAWVTDTQKQQAVAEQEKTVLRARADNEIAWRQYAVDTGIATDSETNQLAEWEKYRVLLMRVDPAKPEWPPLP